VASAAEVGVGEPLTYTLVVTNEGPDAASSVQIVDNLPPGVDFSWLDSTLGVTCGYAGGSVLCSAGTMSQAQFISVTIGVTMVAPGVYRNQAVVTSAIGDPNPADNTAAATATVTTANTVEPGQGTTLVFTATGGLTATVVVPPGAIVNPTRLVLRPLVTPTHPLPPDITSVLPFQLDAYCRAPLRIYLPLVRPSLESGTQRQAVAARYGTVLPWTAGLAQTGSGWEPCELAFERPVTVTLEYNEDALGGVEENDLHLYYWAGSEWLDAATTCDPPVGYTRDPIANVLQAIICHLSELDIGG
jgi:uncharacterized repeat protein (TIGR01451 family)